MYTLKCLCGACRRKKRLEDLIYLCKDWTNISSTTFGIELKTYPVKEHKNNWNKIGIVILGLVFLQGNMKLSIYCSKVNDKEAFTYAERYEMSRHLIGP